MMGSKRKTSMVLLCCLASAPLLGGTGRPSDGLLSFILLLGFLLIILGILQLAAMGKKWLEGLLEGLY